jgi:hypothetical protein
MFIKNTVIVTSWNLSRVFDKIIKLYSSSIGLNFKFIKHLNYERTQKLAFAASMFSDVSLIYVSGILAKLNFKVY